MMTFPNAARSAIAALAACSALAAAAQDNKADGQWRGNGAAALSLTSGNTSASSLLLAADAARATAADKITVGGLINRASSKKAGVSTTSASKWAAFGQYDYNLSPQLYGFGRLGLEGDRLIDLSLRTALAGGLGYKVIATPQTTFDVFGGLAYSVDKYGSLQTIAGTTDDRFSRTSLYLGEASSHQLTPTVSLKQRLELYPGLTGDKAMIAKFSAGLGVAMSSTMNLTVGLTDNYNSKPPAGAKKNDLALFTGVNVKLGAL